MKTVIRGAKIKLYPTYKQRQLISEEARLHRYIWNKYIEFNLEELSKGNSIMSYADMYNIHIGIKTLQATDSDIGFYGFPKNAQSTQQQLKRVEDAFIRYRKGLSSLPRFKSSKRDTVSFSFPQKIRFNKNKSKIFIPSIGEVKCRGYRELPNQVIKQLIVKVHPSGDIEATYIVECENQTLQNIKDLNNSIGLDVGVKKFLTDSDGNKIRTEYISSKNNKHVRPINLKLEIKRLSYLQNKASLAKPEEKNKMYYLVNKQHKRISNIRLNWLHHITNLYCTYHFVAIEDLNIKDMSVNTVGTIDNPNIDSKRKTNLNDKILKSSWGMFFNILKYKLSDRGSYLMVVNKDHTSQICSCCGVIDKNNRQGEVYSCKNCGTVIDADHNAAINIHRRSQDRNYGMRS